MRLEREVTQLEVVVAGEEGKEVLELLWVV